MTKLLCATMLSCVLTVSAAAAMANDAKAHKEPDSFIVKASYSLPKKDGDEFRQTLHEADEENLQAKQKLMLDHADMYDLLTAPDFNRKAFLTKAAEARKLQEQMKENRDEAFSAAAEQLSPEERRTLASAIEVDAHNADAAHHHHKMASHSKDNTSSDNGTVTQ